MTYNHRKPYIPRPPAMPRFALGTDAPLGVDDDDPLDAANTAQVPVAPSGRRRVVRRVRPKADATEEVQVEDILLEVYAEEPPPPLTRRSAERIETPPASASIAAAIASSVPPPASQEQSRAVDALLRASDPAFLPQLPPPVSIANLRVGADYETPSVAPVMLATTTPPPARPAFAVSKARRRSPVLIAMWSFVLVAVAVGATLGILFGIRTGTLARLKTTAQSALSHKSDPSAAASPPSPAPSPPPAAPSPPAVPTVSIDSLPIAPIPPDMTLVTLPAYAQGHRVFVDGRIITVADGTPTKIKCGRHMLKIGSARKARIVDLACGREVTVQ